MQFVSSEILSSDSFSLRTTNDYHVSGALVVPSAGHLCSSSRLISSSRTQHTQDSCMDWKQKSNSTLPARPTTQSAHALIRDVGNRHAPQCRCVFAGTLSGFKAQQPHIQLGFRGWRCRGSPCGAPSSTFSVICAVSFPPDQRACFCRFSQHKRNLN